MMGFDPISRRPASTVPTRRDVRVQSSNPSGNQTHDEGRPRGALVPVPNARANESRPALKLVSSQDMPVASACAEAGVTLQSRLPAPRRGLRADASERARYNQAYRNAADPVRPAHLPKKDMRA